MATLFALLYPDQQSRKAALESVHGLEDAGYLHVLESAQVTKDANGHIEYEGTDRSVRSSTTKGLALGALTGVIFAVPVAGIAVGTVTGLMIGRRSEHKDRQGVSRVCAVRGAGIAAGRMCHVDACRF